MIGRMKSTYGKLGAHALKAIKNKNNDLGEVYSKEE
jgi:hypothetical protein